MRVLLAVCVLALLAGCAGTGIRPGADDAERWQLTGKLGIRADRLAESATIDWRQCGEHFDVRLTSPLGQTVARIEGRGEQLSVWMDGREPVLTDAPEQLLQARLGWSIPVRVLRYWVRGEAAPARVAPGHSASEKVAQFTGPQGQPAALAQSGWQVRYPAWHQREGLSLPARVVVSDVHVQTTLLIREWLLGDAVECAP
jgi:outer membrane lipoprotein LolB